MMETTKVNDAAKRLFDKQNRTNTLLGIAGWVSLALGVILFSFGLWAHFYSAGGLLAATYKDDTVYVEATYGKEAQIPKGAELRARLVTPEEDPDVYSQKMAAAMTAIGREGETAPTNAIYHVGFYIGDQEVEPAAPVNVVVQVLQDGFAVGEPIRVIHFGENDAKVIADTVVDDAGFVSFTTDGFSRFAFVFGTDETEAIETGRVAYFPFDGDCTNKENTGITATWNDDSFSDDSVEGQAASFIGSSSIQIFGLDGNCFNNEQGATISFWSKGSGGWAYYWCADNPNHYTGVEYDGNTITAKYHKNADNNASASRINSEKWHLITVTYSAIPNSGTAALTMKLYVDGTAMAARSNLASFFNEEPFSFQIGGNAGGFRGAIDEFKIYNRVLSDAEIFSQIADPPSVVWFDATLEDSYSPRQTLLPYQGAINRLANSVNDFTTDKNGVTYVRLPTDAGTTIYYDYQLAGWYDIYSKKYYKPGELVPISDLGSDETEHNTVFYADWWAGNYSLVDSRKEQVDDSLFAAANTFVSTNVFDYNELFNAQNETATLKKIRLDKTRHKEIWTDKQERIAFANVYRQRKTLQNLNKRVTINKDHTNLADGRGSEYSFLGIITPDLFGKGASTLFSPVDSLGVNYVGKGASLYQHSDQYGYYYYDSKLNAASYDQSAGRFHVYGQTEKINEGSSTSDFVPFNSGKSVYGGGFNEAMSTNYWFGFSSTISFHLPGDVGTGEGKAKNKAEYGNDMSFTFSGDDDVWVFVDGHLVLDMGGIHDVVFGSINFATGEVLLGDKAAAVANPGYYREKPGTPPGVSGGNHPASESIVQGLKAGDHTLTICYMERGGSQSNCAIYFNLCPSAGLEIQKKDDMTGELLEGAGFTLKNDQDQYYFLNDSDMVEWKDEPTTYYTDERGVLSFRSLPVGTYTLNESEAPAGYQLDGRDITIKVSQREETRDDFDFEVTTLEGMKVTYTDKKALLTVSFPNKPEYRPLQIVKYGAEEKLLAGAEFELYLKDGKTDNGRVLLGTLKSSEDGVFVFETQEDAAKGKCQTKENGELAGLMTGRTYCLKETKAPEGYRTLPEVEFKVTKEGVELAEELEGVIFEQNGTLAVLKLTDPEIMVKVALLKVAYPGNIPLAGAEFKLYGSDYLDSNGRVNESAEALWSGTSIVDEAGHSAWEGGFDAFPKLKVGQYYLVETKAPSGYILPDSIIQILVASDGSVSAAFMNDAEDHLFHTLEQASEGEERMPGWLVDEDGTICYDYVFMVPNSTGYHLPESGGPGTLFYLLTGFVLVLGSIVTLFTRRHHRLAR